MSLKNERKLIYVVAIVCLAVGVFCYASPTAAPPDSPVRMMFKSVGGNVLFDHQTHDDSYGLACLDCHHTQEAGSTEKPSDCSACHKTDGKYVPAMGESGKFDHDVHSNDLGLACSDCHHDYDESEGGEPQLCSDCHEPGGDDDAMLNRKDAFHKQCIGCHEESGNEPGKNDCAGCHEPRKRADAFHTQCINCHEDVGAGPAGGDDDCKKCHGF
jgi:hypothetical protein